MKMCWQSVETILLVWLLGAITLLVVWTLFNLSAEWKESCQTAQMDPRQSLLLRWYVWLFLGLLCSFGLVALKQFTYFCGERKSDWDVNGLILKSGEPVPGPEQRRRASVKLVLSFYFFYWSFFAIDRYHTAIGVPLPVLGPEKRASGCCRLSLLGPSKYGATPVSDTLKMHKLLEDPSHTCGEYEQHGACRLYRICVV